MWIYPLKLVPDNTAIDFVRAAKYAFIASLVALVIGCGFICTKGFNFGIDFIGGTQLEIRSNKFVSLNQLRNVLSDLNIGEISLQSQGQDENSTEILIKIASIKHQTESQLDIVKNTLVQVFPDHQFEYLSVSFIGPQVNSYLIKSGIKAVVLSIFGIFLYIWIRFKLSFGIGILITLLHNLLMCFSFMSIAGLDFNQSAIAALLIIIGYCVNDSIVIYDKILNNSNKLKLLNQETINLSINRTLSRTILTSLTTLLANLALILFGGKTIFSFSLLVFIGILVGTYSSIIFSGPLVLYLSNKRLKFKR
jgi:preprotein translocase subunit SecF